MGYIAHKDGERVQTVKEHLEGTAERAGNFAEKFGKREWGYCCGMLHDIGKYSKEFQKKIQENTNDKVDHATAGAQVCKELGGYYPILSYCIAGHLAGLPDYGNTAISSSLCGRWKKKSATIRIIKMRSKFQIWIRNRLHLKKTEIWIFHWEHLSECCIHVL